MTDKEKSIPEPEPTKMVEPLAEGFRKGGDIVDDSMPSGTPAVPHLDTMPDHPADAPAGSSGTEPTAPSDGGDAGGEQ
jgi:hypothetical protein